MTDIMRAKGQLTGRSQPSSCSRLLNAIRLLSLRRLGNAICGEHSKAARQQQQRSAENSCQHIGMRSSL
jgi:hypothetical protein